MVLLLILGFAAFTVVLTIARGFILQSLWGWFLVPLGLPPIGIANAIGVAMIVSYLTYSHLKKDSEDGASVFIQPFVNMVIVWGVAWVVHLFM